MDFLQRERKDSINKLLTQIQFDALQKKLNLITEQVNNYELIT